ncbi:hypothetical protein [Shewanella sp.]|uniref:hypothetical protein n=1 Tax=Shewanella sp. TaxID=50422 RepID=UPI0040549602
MYVQIDKPKEHQSKAGASSVAQKKNNVKLDFGIVDYKPESIRSAVNTKSELQNPIQLVQKIRPEAKKEKQLDELIKEAEQIVLPWLTKAAHEGKSYSENALNSLAAFNSGLTYYKKQLANPTESDETLRLTISLLINSTINRLNAEIDKANQPVATVKALSPEDQFAKEYPNAIRIGAMDSVKNAVKGTPFEDHQSFISSTFQKPSPNLPKFNGHTVYHDTQGGSGGGFTIFGVLVGNDKFLIAHGHHSSVKGVDYALDWVCANVTGWNKGSVSFGG